MRPRTVSEDSSGRAWHSLIVFSLLHLVRTGVSRQEIVDGEVRRLERKQAKDQRRKSWGL